MKDENITTVATAKPKKVADLKTLQEIKDNLNIVGTLYLDHIKYNQYKKQIEDAALVQQHVDKYEEISERETMNALLATDAPLIEAVKRGSYPTISFKIGKDKQKKDIFTIKDGNKEIDLLRLYDVSMSRDKRPIGNDARWPEMAECYNRQKTYEKSIRLGEPIDKALYRMHLASEEYEKLFDGVDEKTALQTMVNAMIGENGIVKDEHLNALNDVYVTKGRGMLEVKAPNHKKFVSYLAMVCASIVTGKKIDLKYQVKKQK